LKGKHGLVVGRYILLDLIGTGARGRVYKARHSLMDRVVALKAILLEHALSQRSVARFFREMKIVARLDHPNVVRAIDADEHEGCPYIVMEYLEGEDLGEVFARRGPLPPNEVVAYMAMAARGLAHAHEQGVIHRDVKPTNLFLTRDGVVKLLDLGFGELIEEADKVPGAFDTDEGNAVGTADYISPEQISDQPVDARADLFSLGCTMYRLLTGAFAFPGETREDRMIKRVRGRHVPIQDVRPDVPYAVVRVVDRLLAIAPGDRITTAAEVADDLEALLPRAFRPDRRGQLPAGKMPADAQLTLLHAEPDAPPDWSLIESAIRPDAAPARKAPRLVDRKAPERPSSKDLSAHRKGLEEEEGESGREAHEQYRHELIQMNRVMAELRSMTPEDEPAEREATWLERLGEKLGDQLTEPSAGLILVGILALLIILGLALGLSLG
jgi:eukaryotic-like serine/threonine-protein kinase